ncbi:unnamed protein product [Adineta steineri]|uniref:SKICH domain-containing protein n=1 Tax=Adineta steineri TaxID=433720 RepID=A0A816C770_9BILA|nr:unnamed protein product [Adineta steineri]CAF1617704.1 unnamed protein product [Adineta steineri]
MSEISIPRSMTHTDEASSHEQQDQIVFENVADQYVKGDDVTVHFIISNNIMIDLSDDYIGLLRIGCTHMEECLAYAPVQFISSTASETTRHGTAVFPSTSLPTTEDEFYQFSYLKNKRKCLASSIPFQLNCSIDDIDLLSSTICQALLEKKPMKHINDGLITFADQDNDDLVVVHTTGMLIEEKLRQENQQLLEINRRLEQQKDECKAKFELLDIKSNEYINKVKNDMQLLATTHKATIDELSTRQHLEAKLRAEYDTCQALCSQYQSESLHFAERYRTFEDSNAQLSNEVTKLRSQLSISTQLTNEQLVQIKDFEKRLLQSNELLKSANQYKNQLEQQLRDLRLTTEKYQISMQAQLDAYTKQSSQQENQINALETANSLLKDELNSLKADNTFLLTMANDDKQLIKDLQKKINDLNEQHHIQNEQKQNELKTLRKELEYSKGNSNDLIILKNSFNEIEKRCVKHQKSEIEVKKQLTAYKEYIDELQNKVQDLTERLSAGADEYKILYRKYAALERMIVKANIQCPPLPKTNPTTLSNETGLNEEALVTLLRNSYELQQQDRRQEEEEKDEEQEIDDEEEEQITIAAAAAVTSQTSPTSEEIRECPMCYWEFPKHLTLENKKDHIENHFN